MFFKLLFWRRPEKVEPYHCVTIKILSGKIAKERLAKWHGETIGEYRTRAAEMKAHSERTDYECLELPKWLKDL